MSRQNAGRNGTPLAPPEEGLPNWMRAMTISRGTGVYFCTVSVCLMLFAPRSCKCWRTGIAWWRRSQAPRVCARVPPPAPVPTMITS